MSTFKGNMSTQERSERAVAEIVREFTGRGGWDTWWDRVPCDLQEEIRERLTVIVRAEMNALVIDIARQAGT